MPPTASLTWKLLKEGDYIWRKISGSSGLADVYWGTGYSPGEHTKDIIRLDMLTYLVSQSVGERKFGLPLAEIRISRPTTTGVRAVVIYGTARGGGPGRPIAYSKMMTKEEITSVPVLKQRFGFDPELKLYSRPRSIAVALFNQRIEETEVSSARAAANLVLDHRIDLLNLGEFIFKGAAFERLRSNEVRGELVFEQKAAVPAIEPGVYGNIYAVPKLEVLEEWAYDENKPDPQEQVYRVTAAQLYGYQINRDWFNPWWNEAFDS